MDKVIDTRFERLERALTILIDSVAKYNPSAAQARDLDNADKNLCKGLEEVQAHQNNYLRLQRLREESRLLDDQIRECISNLASTRKDVQSIPMTTYPASRGYAFTYDELLSYARRISKTTMPPPGALNAIQAAPATGGDSTPAANGQSAAATPSAATPASQLPPSQQTLASTNTSLPDPVAFHLNPHAVTMFYPWPEEDKIRSGALSRNQMLEEQGIDPKNYDPAAEEERKVREEEEKKQREEEERIAREEEEKRIREERERVRIEREKAREREQEEWRKASITGGVGGPPPSATAAPGEKKQFQFTSIDDMDDDD
ncbi:uncharacterized protein DNG_02765 [Cephalotrichum gorgonifer]|uniref:Mediator of RNA polymerase II transcription subunit 4 n=1 Tax=Cephalotrichum gorgonifer TaxID=2041049 RepID=A0AAE8MU45_9PEZI|nr:uncharacterized protein DNG_02765 [Cephalotrichum gorgonifer]